jgi:hypothetical protein
MQLPSQGDHARRQFVYVLAQVNERGHNAFLSA